MEAATLESDDQVISLPPHGQLDVVGNPPDEYHPGNDVDFSRLYQREALALTRTIYGILGNREEAEDCVQEAFVRAYRKWKDWKPDAPAKYWVQRIAINLALEQHRHSKLAGIKDRLLARSKKDSHEHEDNSDLISALRKLPEKQMTAVLLRFNHGYNNKEIAQTLDISESAVSQRIDGGLAKLKDLLG